MPALSTSEAVGDTVKAVVEAALITKPGATAPVPVVKRKTPSVPEGGANGLPEIVVSVGAEERVERLTATQMLKKYPVAVTIVTADGHRSADDATVRNWRERVQTQAHTRANWTGLSGFNVVDVTNKAPFDTSALSKDFNYSTLVLTVEVIEELP